jgi:ABC-type multidrug transport system ATPase subunit
MPALALKGFALSKSGSGVTMNVEPGQALAIVGPAASGKSRFLEACQHGRAARGAAVLACEPLRLGEPSKRQTPQGSAKAGVGPNSAARASEALVAAGLWEVRKSPASALSPSQLAACELLPALAAQQKLICLDGHLDGLDPWALARVMALLRQRLAEGSALLVVTNRLEVMAGLDWLVLLKGGEVRYAGRMIDPAREPLETVTVRASGVSPASLEERFAITVSRTDSGLEIAPQPGRDLAARLLTEGYGQVEAVVLRRTPLEEALQAMLDG